MEPLQADDPTLVGRFRVVGRLGVGGMGRVYAATGPDGRRAAVKVIRDDLADDTGFRHRFRREVAAASAVVGLFTARVLDADPDGEPPWLATEFVEGPSLRDAVLTHGPMPEHALLDLARGLAEALAAIHAAGLVHRDLKPANVLLSPAGPRVIDFGIARAVDSSRLTVTGQIIGTPDFMAPEQIEGTRESGPEGDVFALGSTLAWAATSRGPVRGRSDRRHALPDHGDAARPARRAAPHRGHRRGVPGQGTRGPADRGAARRPAARGGRRPARWRDGHAAAGPAARHACDALPRPADTGAVTPPGPAGGAGVLAAVVVAGTVTAVTLSAAATPAPGPQPTPPVVTTAAAPVSADSPQTRYVDRLCASGTLLSALGLHGHLPHARR